MDMEKEALQKALMTLLNSGTCNNLNVLVTDFQTDLWKQKVDELKDKMTQEEIKKEIHDWWQNYKITDVTKDNLLAYVENIAEE